MIFLSVVVSLLSSNLSLASHHHANSINNNSPSLTRSLTH